MFTQETFDRIGCELAAGLKSKDPAERRRALAELTKLVRVQYPARRGAARQALASTPAARAEAARLDACRENSQQAIRSGARGGSAAVPGAMVFSAVERPK